MGEFFSKQSQTKVNKKTVLIMDEVDGMTGSDRGGIAELILLIKKSKVRASERPASEQLVACHNRTEAHMEPDLHVAVLVRSP